MTTFRFIIKRLYLPALALGLFTLSFYSCGARQDEKRDDDSDKLYFSTLKLIRIYTDSMNSAVSYDELEGLFANFNQQLEKLNFDVRPDTDLQLNEGRNDTLFMKITALRHLYDERLSLLESTRVIAEETPDSIPFDDFRNDSIQ